MRILIYGLNFSPELTGIGKYTGEMAAWLAANGHSVHVVTAPPYYPAWSVGEGYTAWAYRREQWQGVSVWRCPLWVPKRPGGAKRLVHLASFAMLSLPVMLWQLVWRPQLVWVVEPALFCAPAAWAVARLGGAKAWLHVQDLEVDAAFDLGLLKGPGLRRAVLAAERWLMRGFDVVSTISRRMQQRILDKGVPAAKTLMAPNWVDVAAMAASPEVSDGGRPNAYRAALGIANQDVVALYSGNMGAKQGLELLAEVAHRLADQPNVVFVLCGDGPGKEPLQQQCKGLSGVHFMSLQPQERLPELLAMADIHLLPQRSDAADLVMPSKLTGMLASARPVLATARLGTELAEVVQHCGVAVPPEDADAFAQALMGLAADPALRQRLGAAGLAHARQHMDRDAVLNQWVANATALLNSA